MLYLDPETIQSIRKTIDNIHGILITASSSAGYEPFIINTDPSVFPVATTGGSVRIRWPSGDGRVFWYGMTLDDLGN